MPALPEKIVLWTTRVLLTATSRACCFALMLSNMESLSSTDEPLMTMVGPGREFVCMYWTPAAAAGGEIAMYLWLWYLGLLA